MAGGGSHTLSRGMHGGRQLRKSAGGTAWMGSAASCVEGTSTVGGLQAQVRWPRLKSDGCRGNRPLLPTALRSLCTTQRRLCGARHGYALPLVNARVELRDSGSPVGYMSGFTLSVCRSWQRGLEYARRSMGMSWRARGSLRCTLKPSRARAHAQTRPPAPAHGLSLAHDCSRTLSSPGLRSSPLCRTATRVPSLKPSPDLPKLSLSLRSAGGTACPHPLTSPCRAVRSAPFARVCHSIGAALPTKYQTSHSAYRSIPSHSLPQGGQRWPSCGPEALLAQNAPRYAYRRTLTSGSSRRAHPRQRDLTSAHLCAGSTEAAVPAVGAALPARHAPFSVASPVHGRWRERTSLCAFLACAS